MTRREAIARLREVFNGLDADAYYWPGRCVRRSDHGRCIMQAWADNEDGTYRASALAAGLVDEELYAITRAYDYGDRPALDAAIRALEEAEAP